MLIDILIPTFNRSRDLLSNLRLLTQQIRSAHLQAAVRILVSDNCSSDDTQEQVAKFLATDEATGVEILYSRNPRNIGLESNVVKLLELATSDFVLWTGDDDYLADGYLEFLVNTIKERPLLGCVIPGLDSLHPDGTVRKGRIEDFEVQPIERGFGGVLKFSHLGHQMSGLLVRRTGLLEEYLAKAAYRNPYLFIFFVASRMLQYESFYAPKFSTRVTTFNAKDWGYNSVGLLDEVFKNYLALNDQLNKEQIEKVLLRFTVQHSYRLSFRPLNFATLWEQYWAVARAAGGGVRFRTRLAAFFAKETLRALTD